MFLSLSLSIYLSVCLYLTLSLSLSLTLSLSLLSISLTYRTIRRQLSEVHRLDEGEVILGVPVQAVAVHVERHRVQHVIDRGHYLQVRAGKKSINANFCQRKETTSTDSFFSDTSKSNSQNQARLNCQ